MPKGHHVDHNVVVAYFIVKDGETSRKDKSLIQCPIPSCCLTAPKTVWLIDAALAVPNEPDNCTGAHVCVHIEVTTENYMTAFSMACLYDMFSCMAHRGQMISWHSTGTWCPLHC